MPTSREFIKLPEAYFMEIGPRFLKNLENRRVPAASGTEYNQKRHKVGKQQDTAVHRVIMTALSRFSKTQKIQRASDREEKRRNSDCEGFRRKIEGAPQADSQRY
jgi:hypothetical protein